MFREEIVAVQLKKGLKLRSAEEGYLDNFG
jgi:hypothetical protein